MEISYELLLLLFFIAIFAGAIDAIAGGGSLITLPVLLTLGLPPVAALATNKLQGSVGSLVAVWQFHRGQQISLRRALPYFIAAAGAAFAGSVCAEYINPEWLEKIIPVVLLAVAGYVWFSPRIGDEESAARLGFWPFVLLVIPAIAFYDGLLGPGSGAFFTIAPVLLLGWNMRRATAYSKIINLGSNAASLLAFLFAGVIVWSIGLVMALGQVIGAIIGAQLVMYKGTALVRPLLVMVSVILSLQLISKNWL